MNEKPEEREWMDEEIYKNVGMSKWMNEFKKD